MSLRRRLLIGSGVCVASLITSAVLLLGTNVGTRWLWHFATPYLPQALTIGRIEGSVLGGLRIERLRWLDASIDVAVRTADANLALLPLFRRQLTIERLAVNDVEVILAASAETDADAPNIDLPWGIELQDADFGTLEILRDNNRYRIEAVSLAAGWRGSNLQVKRLAVVSELLTLDASATALSVFPYALDISATWRWRGADDLELAGELTVGGDANEYSLAHRLTTPLAVTSNGSVIDALGNWRVELSNQWQDLAHVVGNYRVRSPEGRLDVVGNLDAYTAAARFDAQIDDGALLSFQAAGEGNVDSIRVPEARAESVFGRLDVEGAADWSSIPTWNAEFSAAGIDVGVLLDDAQGALNARGKLSGSAANGQPVALELAVDELTGDVNGRALTGQLSASTLDRHLIDMSAAFTVGDNRLAINGAVTDELNLAVELAGNDLAALHAEAQGALAAQLVISGRIEQPALAGSAEGMAIGFGALYADRLALRMSGDQGQHELQIDGNVQALRFSAAAKGGWDAGAWQGELSATELSHDDWQTWTLAEPIAFKLGAEDIAVDTLCLIADAHDGRLCLEAQRQAATASFDLDARNLPLAALPINFPGGVTVDGGLNMQARGELAAGVLNGDAAWQVDDGTVSASYGTDTVSATFAEAGARARIVDNRLQSDGRIVLGEQQGRIDAQFAAVDVLASDSALNGTLDIAIDDLAPLGVFVPELKNPAGRLAGALRVGGVRSAPTFGGALEVSDGRVEVDPAGIALTGIALTLRQNGAGSLLLDGRATAGDGEVALRGEIAAAAGGVLSAWIDVQGEDVQVLNLPDQQVTASPDLRLSISREGASLAGELHVPQASLTADTVPTSAVRPSADAIVHLPDAGARDSRRPLDMDLRMTLGDAVQVAGYGLTTRVEGTLRVAGGQEGPYTGVGRLDLYDGEYQAFGQTLRIERGELVFNGPLDSPQLNIRAIREAGEVTAGVNLSGTPTELRSSVFSDPNLSDAEALSYLLTGRPLTNASDSDGNTLNQAAFALGLSRAGAVTEQIRTTLGLETLTLEGGADSSRVVAGKRLGGRLFVEYGYGLVDQLGTLLLRFQLNDRVVVETSSGAATTLDVVYSVKRE